MQESGDLLQQQRQLLRQPSTELAGAWCPVCQVLESQALAGSQALEGSQALAGFQALEGSQALEESQELYHLLLLLLKRPPRLPNTGPEPEWVLAACPLLGVLVLGAFLALELELEPELELQHRPQPPRQLNMVLGEQVPSEGWCQVLEAQFLACPELEVCPESEGFQEQEPQLQPPLPKPLPKPPSMVQVWHLA